MQTPDGQRFLVPHEALTPDNESVQLELKLPFAFLTLNKPGARNAFDTHMWAAFTQKVNEIPKDGSVLAAILQGNGKDLSAGADVPQMTELWNQLHADDNPTEAA